MKRIILLSILLSAGLFLSCMRTATEQCTLTSESLASTKKIIKVDEVSKIVNLIIDFGKVELANNGETCRYTFSLKKFAEYYGEGDPYYSLVKATISPWLFTLNVNSKSGQAVLSYYSAVRCTAIDNRLFKILITPDGGLMQQQGWIIVKDPRGDGSDCNDGQRCSYREYNSFIEMIYENAVVEEDIKFLLQIYEMLRERGHSF